MRGAGAPWKSPHLKGAHIAWGVCGWRYGHLVSITMSLPPINPHDRRRVAVTAAVDPRTVDRYLRGQAVASTCAARIREALEHLGFTGRKDLDEA
jgi:hypothetical protein